MKEYGCLRCGNIWEPRIENPKTCPSCKSKHWKQNRLELNKCEICLRYFYRLHEHHKDGNKKNNKSNNLMNICEDCHSYIHNGRSNKKQTRVRAIRDYISTPLIEEKLIKLRNYWINRK